MRTEGAVLNKLSESEFKALIVQVILNTKVEEALELLSEHYHVGVPKLKVGLPPRHGKDTLGCYVAKNQTICVLNSDVFKEPFIILHEFYHHMRTSVDKKHKGTEKYANSFAMEFIDTYRSVGKCLR